MTTTPPTEAQMVTLDFMLHRAACSKFTFNEQEALRALLDEYARLREDAARLDAVESGLTIECRAGVSVDRWMARNSVTGDYWTAPTARAVIDAARAKEGS